MLWLVLRRLLLKYFMIIYYVRQMIDFNKHSNTFMFKPLNKVLGVK